MIQNEHTTVTEYGTAIGYFVDEDKFIPKGEYKPTDIDRRKQAADILLRACCGGYTEIWLNNSNVIIPGKRGVKMYSERAYAVTDAVLNKLEKSYTVECDF